MVYYIRLRGEQQGPFAEGQLQKLFARGRFGRHYEVSTDGVNWLGADNYPELFPKPPAPLSRRKAQREPQEDLRLGAPVAAAGDASAPVEWFYTHDQDELGPVSPEEMRRLVETGDVQSDDYVWTEGMSGWRALRDVPELARLLAEDDRTARADMPELKTAPMAVASFVLGLAGATVLPILGSVLAIVFGHIALRQVHASQGKSAGKGLAIAGLVLGYLVLIPAVIVLIVFIAILALAPSGTAVG